MRQNILAVTGISGVGKTTLLRNLSGKLNFQHLEASALIKISRAAVAPMSSSDELRSLPIADNQDHLVKQFRKDVDAAAALVVLDAHTLIEFHNRAELIDPTVFEAIGVSRMLFVSDDPAKITSRRQSDVTRSRPHRDVAAIAALQLQAQAQATRICDVLGITLELYDQRSAQVPTDFFDETR